MPGPWRVVLLLCLVTCVGYLVRADVSTGVFSIRLVPHMAAAWGWIGTLVFWSAACVVAALLWLTVQMDGDRPVAVTTKA